MDVVVKTQAGNIDFNLSELKQELLERTEIYNNLIVTKENLTESKKDLAALRKVRSEIDEKKKAVKKSFMEPYTKFENEVKEAFAILDVPISHIDSAVKEFEKERKEEKLAHCKEIFKEAAGDMAEYIPFERLFKNSWLNATAKDKDIVDAVEAEAIRVRNDLDAIRSLGSEIEEKCIEAYKRAGTLTAAIQRNSDFIKAKDMLKPIEKPIEVVKKPATVTFTVSEADAQRVEEMLSFAEIDYERS